MPYKRKSWQEKLIDNKGFPKVCKIDATKSKRWGTGTFVIPAPMEVNELMRRVPKGKLMTIDELRRILARRHGTTIACPITTGIFAWISAHAAAEAEATGKKRITPYWRTLKSSGELNPKYPGGVADLTRRLSRERHTIVQKGKRFYVADFEKRLACLDSEINRVRKASSKASRSPHAQLLRPPNRQEKLKGNNRQPPDQARGK